MQNKVACEQIYRLKLFCILVVSHNTKYKMQFLYHGSAFFFSFSYCFLVFPKTNFLEYFSVYFIFMSELIFCLNFFKFSVKLFLYLLKSFYSILGISAMETPYSTLQP